MVELRRVQLHCTGARLTRAEHAAFRAAQSLIVESGLLHADTAGREEEAVLRFVRHRARVALVEGGCPAAFHELLVECVAAWMLGEFATVMRFALTAALDLPSGHGSWTALTAG